MEIISTLIKMNRQNTEQFITNLKAFKMKIVVDTNHFTDNIHDVESLASKTDKAIEQIDHYLKNNKIAGDPRESIFEKMGVIITLPGVMEKDPHVEKVEQMIGGTSSVQTT